MKVAKYLGVEWSNNKKFPSFQQNKPQYWILRTEILQMLTHQSQMNTQKKIYSANFHQRHIFDKKPEWNNVTYSQNISRMTEYSCPPLTVYSLKFGGRSRVINPALFPFSPNCPSLYSSISRRSPDSRISRSGPRTSNWTCERST